MKTESQEELRTKRNQAYKHLEEQWLKKYPNTNPWVRLRALLYINRRGIDRYLIQQKLNTYQRLVEAWHKEHPIAPPSTVKRALQSIKTKLGLVEV
jgi:hypothetical protein